MSDSAVSRRVSFQFRELLANDDQVLRERTAGVHDGQRLVLGQLQIPDREITDAAFDNGRLTVWYQNPEIPAGIVQFQVMGDPVAL